MSAGRFKTYPDCEASRVADSYRKGPVRQAVGEDSTGDYTGWPKQGRVLSVPGRSWTAPARIVLLAGPPPCRPPSVPLFQPSRSRLAYRRVTCGPRRPARSPCAAPRPQPVAAPPAAPPRQARIQRPQAEVPGSNGGALAHLVDQRAQRAGGDLDAVAHRVGEAAARPVPVLRGREHGAQEQHAAVRVLVVRAQGLAHQSSGSRLIWLIRFTPASEKPSGRRCAAPPRRRARCPG